MKPLTSGRPTSVGGELFMGDKMKKQRVYMLHALWFKPDGGEQRYFEYLEKATPLMEAVGGRRLKSLMPERALIGQFDADLVFFTEFPSYKAYKDFANSSEHHKIAYIGKEATTNSLLVRCVRPKKGNRTTKFEENSTADS